MTQIVGFSGKKQSGKTCSTNFLFGLEMLNLEMVQTMRIDTEGHLCVPIMDKNDEIKEGCIDPCDARPDVQAMLAQTIWPFLKVYQLADPLKWICQNVLGLTWEQCNGSNADKDSETKLRWENMPGNVNPLDASTILTDMCGIGTDPTALKQSLPSIKIHEPGFMTARQVMQFVGTDVFRMMVDNCWVEATLRIIEQECPETAIIPDVRFPNEVEGIQKAGGKVIRFKRAPFAGQDEHASETALDDYVGFDAIIENANMNITEQNAAVYKQLVDWGMLKTQLEAAS
jgi:hypothetical protein